jgi:hypothetical protein
LIGGYALAAHGMLRQTEDIDLLVDPSLENSRRWILALSRLPDGAARELAADPDVFAAQKSYAVRINDEITVVELEGVPPRVLSLEGLLKTKAGDRPKDRLDAEAIALALQALGRR